MSDHAQKYCNFLNGNKEAVEAAYKKAVELSQAHRMHHVSGDDGEAYPLVDMLTFTGHPVTKGKEELEYLMDSIIVEVLMAYEEHKPTGGD